MTPDVLARFAAATEVIREPEQLRTYECDGLTGRRVVPELVALPGVGRKTANVVLGVAFGTPEGVVVDTHVMRLSQRLGWTAHTEPGPIEQDRPCQFPSPESRDSLARQRRARERRRGTTPHRTRSGYP